MLCAISRRSIAHNGGVTMTLVGRKAPLQKGGCTTVVYPIYRSHDKIMMLVWVNKHYLLREKIVSF